MTRGFQGAEAEHVGFILAEVERLNRIIGDLFDAGRPLHLHPQPTDLLDLVHRSVRALQPRFDERGVRVHVSAGADIPAIDVDADRIEQVLINLVQNAIDVSPQGSAVDIELRLGCSREPFAAEPDGELDSLVVSIDDKGEGIAEEDRDKIFEPFYTTKARGTGLGLYVCHHIVEGHGGQIVVNSQPGQGSRFLLFLPVGRSLMGGSRETADLARR
jgi:two-component system sensor histidine kinase HydH